MRATWAKETPAREASRADCRDNMLQAAVTGQTTLWGTQQSAVSQGTQSTQMSYIILVLQMSTSLLLTAWRSSEKHLT